MSDDEVVASYVPPRYLFTPGTVSMRDGRRVSFSFDLYGNSTQVVRQAKMATWRETPIHQDHQVWRGLWAQLAAACAMRHVQFVPYVLGLS